MDLMGLTYTLPTRTTTSRSSGCATLREWEHEFLVTELVPGEVLYGYVARANPYLSGSGDTEFEAYFARCLGYLKQTVGDGGPAARAGLPVR